MFKSVILFFTLTITLFAQTISFEEAFIQLLKNNKDLKSKKLNIEQSKALLNEISASNYGKLTFKETYLHTNHAGYVFNSKLSSRKATFADFGLAQYSGPASINLAPDDLNNPEDLENFETKLVYDLPLFTGFEISNIKDMSQLQIKANEAKYMFDEKLLTLELLKAYNATVASKAYLKALEEAKKATLAYVNYAQELYNEGLVTQIDVKQAKFHNLNTNSRLTEAKNKFKLATAYLGFLIGNEDISDVQNFKNIKLEDNTLKEMQENAILKREDYKFMNLNTQTLKKSISVEESNYYPKVGAHFEYGYSNDKLEEFNKDQDFYIASVGLEFKIFDFQREAKIEKSKIKYKQIKLQEEYMKDAIRLEVKENFLTLQAKKDILKEKKQAQKLSHNILLQSSEMYKNHLIKMTDLLKEQANTQQSNAQAIMAEFEYTFAIAKLKLSIGNNLKDNND